MRGEEGEGLKGVNWGNRVDWKGDSLEMFYYHWARHHFLADNVGQLGRELDRLEVAGRLSGSSFFKINLFKKF